MATEQQQEFKMLRTVFATVLIVAGLALGAPSAARADAQSEFEAICRAAGLEVVDGSCVYEDGSTLTCVWQGDDWACYRTEPKPTLGLFGKLFNTPKVIVTKPSRPGPVEIGKGKSKMIITTPSQTLTDLVKAPMKKSTKRVEVPALKTEAPAQKSTKTLDAPVVRTDAPVEKSTRTLDAPVIKMETITVAPAIKLKTFN